MRCNARQKQLLLDRVVLFTPVQTVIDKGQATRVRRKTAPFLSKRREKGKRSFCQDRLGTHTRNDEKSDCIFPSQEASGRQLIYKNHATAALEAVADGVKSGGNGGAGGEGGRWKRMLRKRWLRTREVLVALVLVLWSQSNAKAHYCTAPLPREQTN